MNVASFFLNLGENVKLDEKVKGSIFVKLEDENDIKKTDDILKVFPDLKKKLKFTEKGTELFVKITKDINKHNQEDAKKVEKVFRNKFPMITYI